MEKTQAEDLHLALALNAEHDREVRNSLRKEVAAASHQVSNHPMAQINVEDELRLARAFHAEQARPFLDSIRREHHRASYQLVNQAMSSPVEEHVQDDYDPAKSMIKKPIEG